MNHAMPALDITPEQWDIVRGILYTYVPDHEIWAFGSRTKGTAKPYSDLDLAIITQTPLPIDTSASLSEAFSESDLPWKVDIVDWSDISFSFRRIIEQDRVILQKT